MIFRPGSIPLAPHDAAAYMQKAIRRFLQLFGAALMLLGVTRPWRRPSAW